jgi:asparagine synthase (glutamine-hydrolysing)
VEILPKIVEFYDQPYADTSALPTYYISKITSNHVKVALNGDAGDENFAGYLWYKALLISRFISPGFKMLPKELINFFVKFIPQNETVNPKSFFRYFHRFIMPLGDSPSRRNVVWRAYFTNELKDFIYSKQMKELMKNDNPYDYLENLFENAPAQDLIDRALFTDMMAYLPENLMVKMDVASMANSLEARSPFLDHRFVEYICSLPSNWKLKGWNSKYILKEAFRDFLPDEIFRRKKQGFSLPVGWWFRYELKDYLKEVILSKKASDRFYFDFKNLKKLVADHIEGRADYGFQLWALLMLELWHQVLSIEFFLKFP